MNKQQLFWDCTQYCQNPGDLACGTGCSRSLAASYRGLPVFIAHSSAALQAPFALKDTATLDCDTPDYSPFKPIGPSIMDLQLQTNAISQ
jgi:hypothetical protein